MSDIMLYLAERYTLGEVISCIVVELVYLGISLGILLYARKNRVYVCMSAFVPIVNLGVVFRVWGKRYKNKKAISSSGDDLDEILSEEEEIDF